MQMKLLTQLPSLALAVLFTMLVGNVGADDCKLVATVVAWMLVTVMSGPALGDPRTPVVVFPGAFGTRLEVQVQNQSVAPECPTSGTFEVWVLNNNPSTEFSQVCQDKLLTLVVDPDDSKPMPARFSNQPGVTVELKNFGQTQSAPLYEPLYEFLEKAGYTRNMNIRVAGYDWRLTPDIDDFLERTMAMIVETYYQNGKTPVHLWGHSNGPLYAQFLLTHTTQAWKNKFIHGFTPIAGNWPGQGIFYPILFTGLNVNDGTFPTDDANAASSATMYQTHPASYMSAADPAVFRNQEVVVQSIQPSKTYTPKDNRKLFRDAGLTTAQELAAYYVGFVQFAKRRFFPNVDVYAEKGSGLPTAVGLVLQDLSVGQVIDVSDPDIFILRDGDINQEDITNDAILVWEAMPCFRFELTDNVGVNHFSLPSDMAVLQRLLANLQRPKSVCP
jgi:lecithin-cholesterol acyltransferase